MVAAVDELKALDPSRIRGQGRHNHLTPQPFDQAC